jgi:hypothetical protein
VTDDFGITKNTFDIAIIDGGQTFDLEDVVIMAKSLFVCVKSHNDSQSR